MKEELTIRVAKPEDAKGLLSCYPSPFFKHMFYLTIPPPDMQCESVLQSFFLILIKFRITDRFFLSYRK